MKTPKKLADATQAVLTNDKANTRAKRQARSATPKIDPETACTSIPTTPAPKGKIGIIISMLGRPEGAGIEELTLATGWQAHSVRGAIAGAIKKRLGLKVTSVKTDAGRLYQIGESQP